MKCFELFMMCMLAYLNTGCNSVQKRSPLEGLGSIGLSPNDSSIVFSFYHKDHGSLYEGSVDGRSIKNILPSPKDTSYVHPVFSSDGRNILFLAFPQDRTSSNIFMIEKKAGKKRRITSQSQIITEAIFAENDSAIYYCKAQVNMSYSPIARSAPHDFDIYRIDLRNLKETRITNLNAYNINGISEIAGGRYILTRMDTEKGMGMYVISINDPKQVKLIMPINNPRKRTDLYSDPYYSKEFNKLAFTAPYELYLMDMENKKAELVFRPAEDNLGHLTNVQIFNHQKKILFKNDNDNDSFNVINFDGSGLQRVHINIQ